MKLITIIWWCKVVRDEGNNGANVRSLLDQRKVEEESGSRFDYRTTLN